MGPDQLVAECHVRLSSPIRRDVLQSAVLHSCSSSLNRTLHHLRAQDQREVGEGSPPPLLVRRLEVSLPSRFDTVVLLAPEADITSGKGDGNNSPADTTSPDLLQYSASDLISCLPSSLLPRLCEGCCDVHHIPFRTDTTGADTAEIDEDRGGGDNNDTADIDGEQYCSRCFHSSSTTRLCTLNSSEVSLCLDPSESGASFLPLSRSDSCTAENRESESSRRLRLKKRLRKRRLHLTVKRPAASLDDDGNNAMTTSNVSSSSSDPCNTPQSDCHPQCLSFRSTASFLPSSGQPNIYEDKLLRNHYLKQAGTSKKLVFFGDATDPRPERDRQRPCHGFVVASHGGCAQNSQPVDGENQKQKHSRSTTASGNMATDCVVLEPNRPLWEYDIDEQSLLSIVPTPVCPLPPSIKAKYVKDGSASCENVDDGDLEVDADADEIDVAEVEDRGDSRQFCAENHVTLKVLLPTWSDCFLSDSRKMYPSITPWMIVHVTRDTMVEDLVALVNPTNKDHKYYGLFVRRRDPKKMAEGEENNEAPSADDDPTTVGATDVVPSLEPSQRHEHIGDDEGIWLKDGRRLDEYALETMDLVEMRRLPNFEFSFIGDGSNRMHEDSLMCDGRTTVGELIKYVACFVDPPIMDFYEYGMAYVPVGMNHIRPQWLDERKPISSYDLRPQDVLEFKRKLQPLQQAATSASSSPPVHDRNSPSLSNKRQIVPSGRGSTGSASADSTVARPPSGIVSSFWSKPKLQPSSALPAAYSAVSSGMSTYSATNLAQNAPASATYASYSTPPGPSTAARPLESQQQDPRNNPHYKAILDNNALSVTNITAKVVVMWTPRPVEMPSPPLPGLVQGETVVFKAEQVSFIDLRLRPCFVRGTLYVTSSCLMFTPSQTGSGVNNASVLGIGSTSAAPISSTNLWASRGYKYVIRIPLHSVSRLEKLTQKGNPSTQNTFILNVHCKYSQPFIRFAFQSRERVRNYVYGILDTLVFPTNLLSLPAFYQETTTIRPQGLLHSPERVHEEANATTLSLLGGNGVSANGRASGGNSSASSHVGPDNIVFSLGGTHMGWDLYTVEKEYSRMGVHSNLWRISEANQHYGASPTYPEALVVPRSIDDDTLKLAFQFRSKGRIPALTYYHENTATITRSSQPMVGIRGARSEQDEALLDAIREANQSNPSILYVIDARPKANAMANQAMGLGYEDTSPGSGYSRCKLEFVGVDNIHVMRDSYQKLQKLCDDAGQPNWERTWLSSLEATRWLEYMRQLLLGAVRIVDLVEVERASVLVHCSDGWDRTAQLCALAEILLHPHFRTMSGFQMLIQKDWCSFGFKFARRCGHDMKHIRQSADDQRSPVFIQFIDCVWQLTRMYPCAFEFNEHFLITLLDHVFSCHFGTFLCNNERERMENKVVDRTMSVWSYINSNRGPFLNSTYNGHHAKGSVDPIPAAAAGVAAATTSCEGGVTESGVLFPTVTAYNLTLWRGYHLRWLTTMSSAYLYDAASVTAESVARLATGGGGGGSGAVHGKGELMSSELHTLHLQEYCRQLERKVTALSMQVACEMMSDRSPDNGRI
eukprot:TRINITY_DN12673_c0_g1_i1.p1 TRINITY_DN12673_c0_g1~~TRINITY_DN12673_c0_g1_i1.p1  ORF type:complete len:1562 (-),score=326.53 TRINITY_DN12673_c0_g1_i1:23-4708(-)